jgi:hypothetical protein
MKFIDDAHKRFYFSIVAKTNSEDDLERKALFYCLGLSWITRYHIRDIYDFKIKGIKLESLNAYWQTHSTLKAVRLAFNLYGGCISSNPDDPACEEAVKFSPCCLFSVSYAPYFFEAVKICFSKYLQDEPSFSIIDFPGKGESDQ